MRLIVARCDVDYTGRLNAHLPEAMRLIMVKADGSVLVHADAGGYKPLNWMTPPTVIEEGGDVLVVRKRPGRARTGSRSALARGALRRRGTRWGRGRRAREGRRRARPAGGCSPARPSGCEEGLRLDRREWPTDVGPVDLMCRDAEGGWVAVEIKRVGTIDAVEQLTRYLDCIRADPARAECRGILAAQHVKPQAGTLAESRGLARVEVDLRRAARRARARA